MSHFRFPPFVWFTIALIGVYLAWSALRDSFTESEFAPSVRAVNERVESLQTAPMIVANVENTVSDMIVESTSVSAAALATCRDEFIELSMPNATNEILCVESRDIIQNGESRSYRFSAMGEETWVLNVLATGTVIESVEFRSNDNEGFNCESEQCTGITINKRDAMGRRTIRIDTKLPDNRSTKSSSDERASLRASLTAKPDQDVAALSCNGQGVTMIGSNNSTINFCPLGGNGFSANEDGSNLTYQFRNLEGESITVHVNAEEAITKVGFDEERLVCISEQCAGVQISAPDAKGERVVNFSGVTLREIESNGESLILNGTLILQPIN